MLASPAHIKEDMERFRALTSRLELSSWLNISDRKLRYLLYALDGSKRYRHFSIPKRSGGMRDILAPVNALKSVQRKLLRAIVYWGGSSRSAFGFVSRRSIVDHAKLHRRKRWVLCLDLKDFFPAIHFGRVRGMFMAAPFAFEEQLATCLAQICCHDNFIPQGAPTSPAISNIICLSLDRILKKICREQRCSYSRYADDICISSNLGSVPFGLAYEHEGVWSVGDLVRNAITECGFEVNEKKTRLKFQRDQQLVTGLVVNKNVAMPRKWRRQLRVILHLRKKHGDKRAMSIVKTWSRNIVRRSAGESIDPIISGKAGFAFHLERNDPRFIRSLFNCYPSARALIPKPYRAFPFRLLSEGKTDVLHLAAAQKHFQARGMFQDLSPKFPPMGHGNGSGWLLKELGAIAKSISNELTIGLLDCDEPKLMEKLGIQPGDFKQIGQSTYVMCLAAPSGVEEPFCIEDLYDWSEASRWTPNQRRLFRASEFDEEGLDATKGLKLEGSASSALYVTTKVIRLQDGHSCLLQKHDFAQMISAKLAPFDEMNFDGFAPTFRSFYRLLEQYYA